MQLLYKSYKCSFNSFKKVFSSFYGNKKIFPIGPNIFLFFFIFHFYSATRDNFFHKCDLIECWRRTVKYLFLLKMCIFGKKRKSRWKHTEWDESLQSWKSTRWENKFSLSRRIFRSLPDRHNQGNKHLYECESKSIAWFKAWDVAT